MMKTRAKVHGAVVLALFGCWSGGALAGEDDALLDVLAQAIEEWRAGVEFRCTFVYREGAVESRQPGLTGEFGSRVGKPQDEAKAVGVFHKLGSQVRVTLHWDKRSWTLSDGTVFERTDSFDSVTTERLYLHYWGREPGADVTIGAREEGDRARVFSARHGGAYDNAFSVSGGARGSLLAQFGPRKDYAETGGVSVRKTDAEHLVVTMTRKEQGGSTHVARVTFWTVPSPPVVERIEQEGETTLPGKGKVPADYTIFGAQFVRCGRFMVPRLVRSVGGPAVAVGDPRPTWDAKEWFSEDLGKAPPTKEDFVVTIPAEVTVTGLRNPPPPGSLRRLDLASYSVDDLAPRSAGPVNFAPKERALPRSSATTRVLWTIAAAAVLVAGGLLAWRRWKSRARAGRARP
jgi:hypothetical protein